MQSQRGSVNISYDDLEPNARARQIGEMLYRNSVPNSVASSHRSIPGSHVTYGTYPAIHAPTGDVAYTRDYIENDKCCGPMSPVRRNFCLLLLFDFILSFLLWLIYTQVVNNGSLLDLIKEEVVHYEFNMSLFDTVLCSAWRFVPLLLAYALFRVSRPWPVALTTLGTCVFLIAKVFIFQFAGSANRSNPTCYVVLVVSFILAWLETWFLDFKVLPREKRARELALGIPPYAEEQSSLLHSGNHNVNQNDGDDDMQSLPYTPEGSDDEGGFRSMPTSRQPSHSSQAVSLCSEQEEYILTAMGGWEKAVELYENHIGWTHERGSSLEEGVITSKMDTLGKVYRLEAYVDCSQQELFDCLVTDVASTHEWNPTVLDSKIIQVLDDCTDIHYTVAAETAGGLVSSRDFVNVRHWKRTGEVIVASGNAVIHPGAPVGKDHVRGENRPGSAWIFAPVEGSSKRATFCWLMSTDIKGWLPKWTVDQALSGTIVDFLQHLRKRVKTAKTARHKTNDRTKMSV